MDFETITTAYTAMKFIKQLYMKRKKKVHISLLLDAVNFSKFNMYESLCNRHNYSYLPRMDAAMYQCIIGNLSMVKFLMRNKKICYHYDLPKENDSYSGDDPIEADRVGFSIPYCNLLSIACKHRHFHIMKYLLSIGYKFDEYYFYQISLEYQNKKILQRGETPLDAFLNGIDFYCENTLRRFENENSMKRFENEPGNFLKLIPLLPKIKTIKCLHGGKIRNIPFLTYISGYTFNLVGGLDILEKLCDLGYGTRAELKEIIKENT
tara:strand:+ start:468 stop:1262 length:795 start_codon:yes stop_codon:yes gene_type:complete